MRQRLGVLMTALIWGVTAPAVLAVTGPADDPAPPAPAVSAIDPASYRVETVAQGLNNPWGLAFLPDGSALVTERPGALRRIDLDGRVGAPIDGVPEVYFAGQGGLLDVALDPDFAGNRQIYLSYSHGERRDNATRIARARLGSDGLSDFTVLFTARPGKATAQHYAGALTLLPDGTLLISIGDGFDYREQAQRLDSLLGKTVRIRTDGSVPGDNPFVTTPAGNASANAAAKDVADAAPEVWSYGHRNSQGLAVDPVSGAIWQHEHGPRGGDELNLLRPGVNYGWPAITYGMDYSGAYVSPYTEAPGMAQPLIYWRPSIAPSGLTVYRGDAFPDWQGDLFLGALVDREVRRIDLQDGRIAGQQALLGELGERIRNVRGGPDGALWVLTDGSAGKLLRVLPR